MMYSSAQAALDYADPQAVVSGAGASPGAAASAVELDRRGAAHAAACHRQGGVVRGVVRACACAAAVLLPVAGLRIRLLWRAVRLRLRCGVPVMLPVAWLLIRQHGQLRHMARLRLLCGVAVLLPVAAPVGRQRKQLRRIVRLRLRWCCGVAMLPPVAGLRGRQRWQLRRILQLRLRCGVAGEDSILSQTFCRSATAAVSGFTTHHQTWQVYIGHARLPADRCTSGPGV